MTLQECIDQVTGRLDQSGVCFGHGTDNAYDEACWLVLSALGLSVVAGDIDGRMTLDRAQRQAVDQLADARIEQRLPVAYLTGEAWFCGLSFEVNPDVIIPRSPIAELIQKRFSPWLPGAPRRVLDLCCGSGCIGIACAVAFPQAELVLSDLSADALAVCQRNMDRHGVSQRAATVQSDLFEGVPNQRFDLIVSNPPYVPSKEYEELPMEYRHEPAMALLAGDDGLDIVRQIFARAADFMSRDGVLILEVGNSQAMVERHYPQTGFIWLEFEHGGHGVLMMTRDDLLALCANHDA